MKFEMFKKNKKSDNKLNRTNYQFFIDSFNGYFEPRRKYVT